MALKTKTAYDNFVKNRKVYEQDYEIPEPPLFEEIDNHDIPVDQQRFKRTVLPFDFDNWDENEQNSFIDKEWEKIDNGYWFFNNGKLVYITGAHYFYINWWLIMITEEGKPKVLKNPRFVDSDVSFFYMWDKAEKAKNIAGLIYITNRRDGKSYKFGCITYLRCIQYKNSNHGIQSKTKDSAEKFLKQIIDSWRELPWIFKPADSGVTNPTKSLDFSEPSRKLINKTKKQKRSSNDFYNSHINYGSTTPTFYDGQNLLTYINDESGKNVESDVHKTLQIVLETMVAGSYITGKCGVTSTVEEMEKGGGANLKKIWDESDPNQKDSLGRTKNKLIRYFKPAYYGLEGEDENGVAFVNKFGETDWRRAKAFLEMERENLSGESLAQRIRMYPFTIDEAFQSTQDCYFDSQKINQHIDYNNIYVNENNLYQGDFHWVTSASEGKVYWNPNPEGKFLVSWFPNEEDRNQFEWINTEEGYHRSPLGINIRGGADPFDHKTTVDNRRSDAAFHLFRKKTVWDGGSEKDPLSGSFILEYIHRPPTPEEFYDDIIKASVFYSARILVETNKSGLLNEFRRQGYYAFVMHRPESTHSKYSKQRTVERGIALSGDIPRRELPNRLMSYVHNEMGKGEDGALKVFMPFNRTLNDWLRFDPNSWTDYDATVSAMLALVASDVEIKIHKQEVLEDVLPIFDNSGQVSRRIR